MPDRRSFLRFCGTLAVALFSLLKAGRVPAKPAAGDLDQAIADAVGRRTVRESSGDVHLETPEIAENGAIVPITVESSLSDVREILLFVEKNPTPLAARFLFEPEMDAFASVRIKMNESCDVLAVVRSGNAFHGARRKVKVVVGGCG